MRLSRRTARHLICLTSLLAFASTPLLAQRGIDLLDPEQVLRIGEPSPPAGTVTVRAALDEAPSGVIQASNESKRIQYDDGEFENFAEGGAGLRPVVDATTSGLVEWAQLFRVDAASTVVRAEVCFHRPMNDPNRSLDFNLRFYSNTVNSSKKNNPGRRSGLRYDVESNIRSAGGKTCAHLRGHLTGKPLARGLHWVGVEWNRSTRKRLGGDHYTADDPAEKDRNNDAVHETEVRWRDLPVPENASNDGWVDGRQNLSPKVLTSGLKAVGIRLVVSPTHATTPDPDPDPTPDPDPDPTPEPPGPDPNPGPRPAPPAGEGYSDCSPTVAPLTFDGGFKVSLCYETPNGTKADARAVYKKGASGLLYFFGEDNAEVFVKVLNGCNENGHRWLYVAPLTDLAFNMYINDGRAETWRYHNKPGVPGEIMIDQTHFPCSP